MSKSYLKGLNTLRFFAAFFVIIAHGNISLTKMGFDKFKDLPFFNRHGDAVEFFFTLSGFLITYLLQKEIEQTGTISVRAFYLRRVFRIWPLYFLIVLAGFLILGVIYPRLSGQHFFEFSILRGVLLFICFLPNLATALYPTGLLHPLWSIGVEEQYYLVWAPLVKLFRKNVLTLAVIFFIITYSWFYVLNNYRLPISPGILTFLLFQKFYAMATGGIFGLILSKYPQQYKNSIFATRLVQVLILAIIAYYYFIGYPYFGGVMVHFLLSCLYGLLILNTVASEKPVIGFENRLFSWLGVISYGLYMFHMLIDYFLRYIAGYLNLSKLPFPLILIGYEVLLLGGAIFMAAISYKYFESYFLRLKERYA